MQEIMHGITVDPLIKGGKPVIKGSIRRSDGSLVLIITLCIP